MAKREMKTQKIEEPKVEQNTMVSEEQPDNINGTNNDEASISVGVVVGCEKLNVRKQAKSDAIVTTIIDKNSKVTIDDDKSTDEWYRVKTENGVWGYCMKKFIKLI